MRYVVYEAEGLDAAGSIRGALPADAHVLQVGYLEGQ